MRLSGGYHEPNTSHVSKCDCPLAKRPEADVSRVQLVATSVPIRFHGPVVSAPLMEGSLRASVRLIAPCRSCNVHRARAYFNVCSILNQITLYYAT